MRTVTAVRAVTAVAPMTAVRAVAAVRAMAAVTAVAAVAAVTAVGRVRQVLREQDVLAVRFGSQRFGRLGGVQRGIRIQRLAGFLDASIRYNITRTIDVMAQATNITNEPQVMFRPVEGQVAQTEYSGRTYFLGAHFHY